MKIKYLNSSLLAIVAICLLGCETTSTPVSKDAQPEPASPYTPTLQAPAPSVPAIKVEVPKVEPIVAKKAGLKSYEPTAQLSGVLRSIGSDSMDEVMELWERRFGEWQPNLRFRHEGKGSSTAIPALLEGRANFGPMSRRLKPSEVAQFEERFGYAPTQFAVGSDALAVYVHPSNPILQTGLSLAQLEAIFAETGAITRWGQLGLKGEWENAPIRLQGRNSASGTYAFFREKALNKASFKNSVNEHVGSADVVRSVAVDPYSIGYSGIAYMTPLVRSVPLIDGSGRAVAATGDNAINGTYPLARSLYLALNLDPQARPSQLQSEFMRFVYSAEAQAIMSEVGYFPVSSQQAEGVLRQF